MIFCVTNSYWSTPLHLEIRLPTGLFICSIWMFNSHAKNHLLCFVMKITNCRSRIGWGLDLKRWAGCSLKLEIDNIQRWNPGWRGRRGRLLEKGNWRMQERNWSGIDYLSLCNINITYKASRELEEQLEKLRDRLTEASEGESWRSNEQEDVTECQYQVRRWRGRKAHFCLPCQVVSFIAGWPCHWWVFHIQRPLIKPPLRLKVVPSPSQVSASTNSFTVGEKRKLELEN